jgi:hypothetical protein
VSKAVAGAEDVRLFRNGSLVKVWHGDVLKGQIDVRLKRLSQLLRRESPDGVRFQQRQTLKAVMQP